MANLIEDIQEDGYIIRTDLMKEGDTLQCIEDPDMHVKKESDGVVLTKKCFIKNCFSH